MMPLDAPLTATMAIGQLFTEPFCCVRVGASSPVFFFFNAVETRGVVVVFFTASALHKGCGVVGIGATGTGEERCCLRSHTPNVRDWTHV